MSKSKVVHPVDPLYLGIFKSLRILMHFTAAVQFSYAVYYDYSFVRFPISDTNVNRHFGGKFKYLTFIDAIIQAIYYSICLINDFVGSNEVVRKPVSGIRKLKDYMMASLAFPVALNVGLTFWTLYAIDRELVFPSALDEIFPSWLNHVMHTNIVIFIILEVFTSFHSYPKRSKGITVLLGFVLTYLVWLHIVKQYSGTWVYPVLEVLPLPLRIVFFVAMLIFTLCLYLFGEYLNNKIWAKELKQLQRKIK